MPLRAMRLGDIVISSMLGFVVHVLGVRSVCKICKRRILWIPIQMSDFKAIRTRTNEHLHNEPMVISSE